MKRTYLLIVLVISAQLLACVSSSKHQKIVDDLEGQLSSERATKEEMQKALSEMRVRQAEQKKRLEEFADLTRRFKKLTDSGALSVKIREGKMVVSLGSDLLFPEGSARLSKDGIHTIQEVSVQLASIPEKRYQVEGHTDNLPINTQAFPSNWELGWARAITVMKEMVARGMPMQRINAASFADNQPISTNETVEGRASNRRVEIVIVPDLSSLPGYEELQKLSPTKNLPKKAL